MIFMTVAFNNTLMIVQIRYSDYSLLFIIGRLERSEVVAMKLEVPLHGY